MRRLITFALLAFALGAPAQETGDTYRLPPKEIIDVVDAPLTPAMNVGPGDWAVLSRAPVLLAISDLSQPELKLAGLRFNPRTHEQTRAPYAIELRLLRISSGEQKPIAGLPSSLRARNLAWSPDGTRLAFTAATDIGVELWVAEIASATARRVGSFYVNASSPSRPVHWLSDNATLAVRTLPQQLGAEPEGPRVPSGPVIQENIARRTPGRTYQDLLRNPYDATLYEHHLGSQAALVGLDGNVKPLGAPALIARAEPSPDGNYLLVETIQKPFSYVVPEFRFPRRVEVWDRTGNVVRRVADLPLRDTVGTDFDAVPEGARDTGWRDDRPATLYWVEALDKGDTRAEAAQRDRLMTLSAPFAGDAQQLAVLALRFEGVEWGSDDLALVTESWWKTRRTRTWRVRPGDPGAKPELIFDRSSEDRYSDPGFAATKSTAWGTDVIRRNGDTIYLFGEGASTEGDRPFIDAFNLKTKTAKRAWRSEAPYYEYPVEMIDDGRRVVTRRESVNEPPNFFLRDLRGKTARALTQLPHPTPQLANVKKELIRYKRNDGVDLSGTLYLPAGYDAARDGRLPVLLWAYPSEFKTAAAASQITTSPYKFIRVSPMSALPWLVRGYAVLDDPSIPIIGEGTTEPNDTYVDQLVAGAQAAVDELVRRGVGDRDRMAIGGHSYGAFMAANLLAHSDIFRAAIARSGAYNRTLTPFSFQAEERTFWQAPETYIRMSPFTHADKINEPLLMTHGIDDNNTGTFPIQSERLYAAMKGLGGTVRLVMLPYEAHGYRARESVMHMLWEMDRWLDKYVKNAKPRV